jgi:hypothetical protein
MLIERVSIDLNAEVLDLFEAHWWINNTSGKRHEEVELMALPYIKPNFQTFDVESKFQGSASI